MKQLLIFLTLTITTLSCTVKKNVSALVDIQNTKNTATCHIKIDGKQVTSLHYGRWLEKPILYPINTLNGNTITRGWPLEARANERVDHPHQVGHWFNFGDVNGYDFWNNSKAIPTTHKQRYGKIVVDSIFNVHSGDTGQLSLSANWVTERGIVLLKEVSNFRFWKYDSGYAIQRHITLTSLFEPVRFKDNKEGLFAIRMAREFELPTSKKVVQTNENNFCCDTADYLGANGNYFTSNNTTGGNTWGNTANWCAVQTKLQNEPVTVSILNAPSNIGSPPHWHTRHYGLFAANNMGSNSFVKKDKNIQFTLMEHHSFDFNYTILVSSLNENYNSINAIYEQLYPTK